MKRHERYRTRRLSPSMRVALAVIFIVWLVGIILLFRQEERRAPEQAKTGIVPANDTPTSTPRSTNADARRGRRGIRISVCKRSE